jgi:hypothetical protein
MAFGTEQSQTPVVCVLHCCGSAIAVPSRLSHWEALLLTRPAVLLCLPMFLLLLLQCVMRAALPAAAAFCACRCAFPQYCIPCTEGAVYGGEMTMVKVGLMFFMQLCICALAAGEGCCSIESLLQV